MKKAFQSVVAVLLVAFMLAGLIACSGAISNSSAENSTSDNAAKDKDKWMDDPGANGDANLRLPRFNFKSDTVTILNTSDIGQPDPKSDSALRDIYKIKYTTIVVSPEEKINKFVSLVMAGDSPDILLNDFMPSLINKGYLQPWDTYIDFNIGIWQGVKSSLDNIKFKGAYYTIAGRPSRWDMVWYNKEIFEENGIKTPLEYYKEGNWTWDTFRDCAKALTVDSNSDGEPEMWGSVIDSTGCFIYTTGKDFVTLNSDGTVANNVKGPEIARAMQFYIDLCIKDKVVYQGDDGRDQFAAGKVAMIIGGAWYRGPFIDLIKADKLFYVPYPRDPNADKYYISEGYGTESLAKDCKNPEGASAVECATRYDILDNKDDYRPTNEELLESTQWTLEMDDWLWQEFYDKGDKVPVLQTYWMFDIGQFGGDIWFRPKQGEPWATIAEELSPKIDAAIDKVMEG